MSMKTNKPIAFVIFLLSATCLIITTLMTRQSGVSQAATAEGQLYLGWASIAIHLGLPAFGVGAGILMRAGNKIAGVICMVFVFLCAAFSVNNVMSFVASERMSITQARDAETKAKAARENAALKAGEKRQEAHAKMVQDQIRWNQSTTKEVDGRKERKDMLEANAKLIQDFAKTEVTVTTGPIDTAVTIRPDAGVQMIAEFTGWNVGVLQLSNIVQIVIMLILFESFGWSMGAYLWAADKSVAEVAAAAMALSAAAQPVAMAPRATAKLLPPPRRDKPPTIKVEPDTGWRALLDEVDYPAAGSIVQGTPRHKDKREHVAPRFLVWLHAHGLTGDITTDNMAALYDRFNSIDHRVPWGERIVKSELEALGKRFASKTQANGTTIYSIQPQTPDKVRVLLEKKGVITPQGGHSQGGAQDPLEADPEPETSLGAEPTDSKLLSFNMFRSRQAGGQVH